MWQGARAEDLFRNEERTFGQSIPKAETPSLQQVAGSNGNFSSLDTLTAEIEEERGEREFFCPLS